MGESSRRRLYTYGVHGSMRLGKRVFKSPMAMTRLERITSSGLRSRTVKSSCRCCEQKLELTSMNSARQRLAAARRAPSTYLLGFELMATTSGAVSDSRLCLPVTISFSHNCNYKLNYKLVQWSTISPSTSLFNARN